MLLVIERGFIENLVLFIGGAFAGLCTALPLGPTNLWLVRAALPPARRLRNVSAFVVGLVFFDAFYAALGYWGYSAWFSKSTYIDGAMFVGGCGLTILGLYDIWTLCRAKLVLPGLRSEEENASSVLMDLLKGFILGSNPTFIAYWLVVVGSGVSYLGKDLTPMNMLAVFLGIVSADLLWYSCLFCFSGKFAYAASGRLIYYLSFVVGLAFVSSGVALVYRSFLM